MRRGCACILRAPLAPPLRFRTLQNLLPPAQDFRPSGGEDDFTLSRQETRMSRFIIERDFPNGLEVPITAAGADACSRIVAVNAAKGVTWLHSYVSPDKRRTYCVYDAPSADAIREVAHLNQLPVGSITQVTVLDPYFYH
jgi:hypothetical protein